MFLDRDEMKFAILYTLKRYVEPVTMDRLGEVLTWDREVMGYFELAEFMNELTEDGYVESTYYIGDLCYNLSDKGKDTNDFFFERIPKSIRQKIDKAVHTIKFAEQADPNAIRTEILPTAPQQYMASLQMLDAGEPLLELRIFSGSKAQAEKASKNLKAQAHEIYKDLVKRIED
ncbi:MAG: DUF4364 family protein [Clostridia bacterium]|nr:DUF4364 family protein [Clostridia bacterium]